MKHYFDVEYDNLREKIITMGTTVEQQLYRAVDAVVNKNETVAEEVIEKDKEIDALEMEIDNECVTLFARFQPMAFDLRFITSVIKINNDFERIGDQTVNIAQRALYLTPRPHLKVDITPMASLAKEMFHIAVDALVNNNIAFAEKVLELEKQMDQHEMDYFSKIVPMMKDDPKNVKRGLHVLLMARCFERIGDLTTNVAEDIIFYMKAKDVRHQQADDSKDK